MMDLKNQPVLILGLGVSGLAMARWCARAGASVTVVDTRAVPPQLAALHAEFPSVKFMSRAFGPDLMEGTEYAAVFRSPGLLPDQVAPVLIAAHALKIRVNGELGLFFHALSALKTTQYYAPCILGISGTNGKTTVTSLTGQLVERAGKSVAVAGNIGPTLLDTLTACTDADALPEVWVLELSSFQLDAADNFEPSMGTVLNITQDHLDWHGDMKAYASAKARIFGSTAPMLLNRNDPVVMGMLPPLVKGKQLRDYVTFGTDMPQRPGDFGLESVNGMTWLVRAMEADETRKRKKDDEEIFIQRLMPADALRIRGHHNAANALAALALACQAGCTLGPMLYGLREYRGEPHRVESVAIVCEIEYFDDSKGTNVGATVAAMNGLGVERKLVVILGGDGKGQDFSPLSEPVSRYARAVILIGKDALRIQNAVANAGVSISHAISMQDAVHQASKCAHAGDAVLMSPACASFDMFDNYEHRAKVYVAAVQELAQAAGQSIEVTA
jgi:UDP-N-acetylmuramoylalanine--D-glutamate ligase